jgi:hypothetical protein
MLTGKSEHKVSVVDVRPRERPRGAAREVQPEPAHCVDRERVDRTDQPEGSGRRHTPRQTNGIKFPLQ